MTKEVLLEYAGKQFKTGPDEVANAPRDITTLLCLAYCYMIDESRKYELFSDSREWYEGFDGIAEEIGSVADVLLRFEEGPSYTAADFSKLKLQYEVSTGKDLPEWVEALKSI